MKILGKVPECALFAFLLLGGFVVWAQQPTGKILGKVTDPKGAAVCGAKIKATNVATGISNEATADQDGFYQISPLPIGTYRVSTEHPGFQQTVVPGKKLEINQTLRIDIPLESGSPAAVLNSPGEVETANPTLGQSVTARPLINLPLNGRNVLQLGLLQPGVSETNPDSTGPFSVAGGRADSITFLLDGGINNDLLGNALILRTNPDAVGELRILTSNYSAEYGRNAGGIVTVVTRSGTNSFHGRAYEYLRNDALNASSFFNNQQGIPRDILKRNQFGATVGGPVAIPKLLPGRDRFFFFAGYEGQRLVQQVQNGSASVFTPAELNGDYSLSNATRTGPDPGVVTFLRTHRFFQSDPRKAAQGIIDPTRIDPVAKNYIAAGLIPSSPTGDLFSSRGSSNNSDALIGRFDFLMTSKDRLAVTLGSSRNPLVNPFSADANVAGFPVASAYRRYYSSIGYTRFFSASIINELHFTTNRSNRLENVPARQLPKSTDLGINIISDDPTGPTAFLFPGKDLKLGFSHNGPTSGIANIFSWADTLSVVRSRHSWKFGGSFSAYQNNTMFDYYNNGVFTFTKRRFTGNNFADFFIGAPQVYQQFAEAPSNLRTKETTLFVQDEWRLRRNLVVSLGLRYQYDQPLQETQRRFFSLQLGQQSQVFPLAPLGLVFSGDWQGPDGQYFRDANDWAPRVGFAWDPRNNGKTSIRGGFGVFYDVLKREQNQQFSGQAPFFGFASLSFRAVPRTVSAPLNYLSDPFTATGTPNNFPSTPPPSNVNFAQAGVLPIGGAGVNGDPGPYFVDPHLRTPYVYQYNFSIQRELARDLLLETSYVGSSSHKLTGLVDANPFILGNPAIVRLYNNQTGIAPDTFSYAPEFRNIGNASYNSLQASLQKRLSNNRFFGNSYFTFAYTYAHSIDNSSGFQEGSKQVPFYNRKQFRSSSDFDIRHRVALSGAWDLPFDRAWTGGPRLLTRGWSLYPIVTWHTGFPLDVRAGANFFTDQDTPGPSGAGDSSLVHANLVGNSVSLLDPKLFQTITFTTCDVSGQPVSNTISGNFWFSPTSLTNCGLNASTTAAVMDPTLRTYGSLPRNFFRGPGITNFDLALAKLTSIGSERPLGIEFRAEFFNLLNHTQFSNPGTDISAGAFGRISRTADPRILQFGLRLTY